MEFQNNGIGEVRTLKRIGKIVTAVGVGIMFFGGMCDADGIYYYYLIAVIALGALVSLAGLAIMSVELCAQYPNSR